MPAADAGGYEFPCLAPNLHSGEPTFSAVYREIFCDRGCANLYCHGSRGEGGGLSFETMDRAYASLVSTPPGRQPPTDGSPSCVRSTLMRVEKGSPERSLLYLKVNDATPPCGVPMPPPNQGFAPLSTDEREQLRRWIELGANDDRDAP